MPKYQFIYVYIYIYMPFFPEVCSRRKTCKRLTLIQKKYFKIMNLISLISETESLFAMPQTKKLGEETLCLF